ncbi:MarR family winged helix-turn-helix transcriptional regulator [Thermogemmatispora tikiterensis]|nr:MarR family transcriptional regulator [Thermogemmatispora tikiterensis]
MSSDTQENRAEMLAAIKRELRKSNSFGAAFFRVAATQAGLAADTDIQVLDLLDLAGEVSAGQLAELMGMISGAIAKVLNRLEASGLVYRERDKSDGRRVIVRLTAGKEELRKVRAMLAALEETWDEVISSYNEEQLAFLLAFLQRSNTLSRQQLLQLQETALPEERSIFSAPLDDLPQGRLVFLSAGIRLVLRTSSEMAELYQARFKGAVPNVTVQGGVVTIRYPRQFLLLTGDQRQAEITLNGSIPWQIVVQSGGSDVFADLSGLNLASFEVRGVGSQILLQLPVPSGVVPIRISGGGSEIVVQRPAGVAAQAHLKGWGSAWAFDGQTYMGNKLRLSSAGFDPADPYYLIEVTSSGSTVTITSLEAGGELK